MKNDFTKFVLPESVITLSDTKKLDVMDKLIDLAADLSKLDRDTIFRLIWKREQMMTTAVGGKLALPHIRINDILNPLVLVGICKNPIEDYKSQDDSQVQVIVFTVAPDENQEAYLQLLSSISRRFRNPEFIENLIDNAGQNNIIYDLIVNTEA